MEKNICQSCGMPMRKPEDFGGGNTDNIYCVHCTNEKGDLLPWEQKLEGTKNFIMKTSDVGEKEANKAAEELLKKNPAWIDR